MSFTQENAVDLKQFVSSLLTLGNDGRGKHTDVVKSMCLSLIAWPSFHLPHLLRLFVYNKRRGKFVPNSNPTEHNRK